MSNCVCVCSLLSVSNHWDPRVAWLGQGAGTQWRGCPTVAASFRHQSKSGMEREVGIAWKQVTLVVKADVTVQVCVCVWLHKWSWILDWITFCYTQTANDTLACRHTHNVYVVSDWLRLLRWGQSRLSVWLCQPSFWMFLLTQPEWINMLLK